MTVLYAIIVIDCVWFGDEAGDDSIELWQADHKGLIGNCGSFWLLLWERKL